MAAGCTLAIPPRRLRTHTRRGSSPGEKFDEWEGKGLTHPEKLLSSRDAEFAEDRTIVVGYLLPLREFVTVEKSQLTLSDVSGGDKEHLPAHVDPHSVWVAITVEVTRND